MDESRWRAERPSSCKVLSFFIRNAVACITRSPFILSAVLLMSVYQDEAQLGAKSSHKSPRPLSLETGDCSRVCRNVLRPPSAEKSVLLLLFIIISIHVSVSLSLLLCCVLWLFALWLASFSFKALRLLALAELWCWYHLYAGLGCWCWPILASFQWRSLYRPNWITF